MNDLLRYHGNEGEEGILPNPTDYEYGTAHPAEDNEEIATNDGERPAACYKCGNVFDESEYFPLECVRCGKDFCKECGAYQRNENDEWDWNKPTCFDCLYPDFEDVDWSKRSEA